MFFKKKLQRVQESPDIKNQIKQKFDLFIKHKIYWRITILFFLILIVSCIFSFNRIFLNQDFKIGTPAKEDLYMITDIFYIDQDLTNQKIEQASLNIPLIYDIDINLTNDISQELDLFFTYLVKEDKSYEEEDFLSDYMSEHFWKILQDSVVGDPDIIKIVKDIQYRIMRTGVITDNEKYQLIRVNYKLITLRDLKENTEKEFSVEKLINERILQKLIKSEARDKFKKNIRLRYAVEDLLDTIIKPNIIKNEEEYNLRKTNIKNKIEPVFRSFLKGDLILRKGDRIREQDLNIIKEMYAKSSGQTNIYRIFAVLVVVLLSILVGVGFAKRFYPAILYNWKLVFLFSIVLIAMSALIRFFQGNYSDLLGVPVVMGAMLLTILSNAVVGMIIVIVLSIYAMISSQEIAVIGTSLICGVISIFLIYRVVKRVQIIRAGIIVGLASAVIILSLNLFWQGDIAFFKFWKNALISWGSIFVGSLLIIVILPLFERLFKITTNIRLLELSDENHPLLKKLVDAAPGTYNHSLIVSRLAEDATKAIGGNVVLAKVGALYHDIGKINKPEYFIENHKGGKGKHEKLTPNMSSLVIIAHVKDGYELAQKYNLGEDIEHIIRGHHGSGLMYFFYKKAVQNAGGEEEINEDKFRYPGPKPHSKECAIIMLADSVEAASRSLEDPTASRIKGLIKRVIDDKFIDEQLVECSLTLKDLSKIESSFLKIMTGVFHQRIEYPK